jgi:hypothetical protein
MNMAKRRSVPGDGQWKTLEEDINELRELLRQNAPDRALAAFRHRHGAHSTSMERVAQ